MASYYLIWSILFTSFSLLGAYDLVMTVYKAKKTKRVIAYVGFESISLVGYFILMAMLFSPEQVNTGFETPFKYAVISLSLFLWGLKLAAVQKGRWQLNTISLKDALRDNQEICFVFDNKGRLVQRAMAACDDCFWLQNILNKESFLRACMENAYEKDFLLDPQFKIKRYTEKSRKVVSFKRDTITNNKMEVIGEIWIGTDITELQTVYEALKESQNELIEVQSVLVNYLDLVEDYERTKAEQDISLRMNELIGQEMMTLLKQLQVMEIDLKEKSPTDFNRQLTTAIASCKDVIKDVRKTVQLISTNSGEPI